jgi:hypothetical protein
VAGAGEALLEWPRPVGVLDREQLVGYLSVKDVMHILAVTSGSAAGVDRIA